MSGEKAVVVRVYSVPEVINEINEIVVARDRDAERLRPHTQEEIRQNKKVTLHVASVPGGSLIPALVSAGSSGLNLSALHRDKQIHYGEGGKSTITGFGSWETSIFLVLPCSKCCCPSDRLLKEILSQLLFAYSKS